jgi:hypothetical protein
MAEGPGRQPLDFIPSGRRGPGPRADPHGLRTTLWLLGYPDQAMRAAASSIDAARAIDHTLNLCFALTWPTLAKRRKETEPSVVALRPL